MNLNKSRINLDGGDEEDEEDGHHGDLLAEGVDLRHPVQEDDEQEVEVGEAVELLEEVLGREGEQWRRHHVHVSVGLSVERDGGGLAGRADGGGPRLVRRAARADLARNVLQRRVLVATRAPTAEGRRKRCGLGIE